MTISSELIQQFLRKNFSFLKIMYLVSNFQFDFFNSRIFKFKNLKCRISVNFQPIDIRLKSLCRMSLTPLGFLVFDFEIGKNCIFNFFFFFLVI